MLSGAARLRTQHQKRMTAAFAGNKSCGGAIFNGANVASFKTVLQAAFDRWSTALHLHSWNRRGIEFGGTGHSCSGLEC